MPSFWKTHPLCLRCIPLAMWVQKVILKDPSALSQVYSIILKDPSTLSQVYSINLKVPSTLSQVYSTDCPGCRDLCQVYSRDCPGCRDLCQVYSTDCPGCRDPTAGVSGWAYHRYGPSLSPIPLEPHPQSHPGWPIHRPHFTQVCILLSSLHTGMHPFVTQVCIRLSLLHTGVHPFVLTSHR